MVLRTWPFLITTDLKRAWEGSKTVELSLLKLKDISFVSAMKQHNFPLFLFIDYMSL